MTPKGLAGVDLPHERRLKRLSRRFCYAWLLAWQSRCRLLQRQVPPVQRVHHVVGGEVELDGGDRDVTVGDGTDWLPG